MQDANKQTKYDLDIIDYKNNLIACINRARADLQTQQQVLQTINQQQQLIMQVGNNETKQDVLSSKALSIGQAHRMQRHINKLDLEIDKLEQKLQALETRRLQVDKPLAFAEKDKQVMLKSIAYDKGVFSAKQAELKQQRQQKLNQQQEFSQAEQSAAFEQTKTSRQQTMQQKQQELHRLEQEEQTLQQKSQASNVTAILSVDLRRELNSKINNLHREIKQLTGQTYTELIKGLDNSLLEEKLVNTNLRTQVKLIDSEKTVEEKQKIIARSETFNELSFNLERAHARTKHITTPLLTGALVLGVYSNPITTLGATAMYSVVDPYVTGSIQSGISTGLEWYSVDAEVANTVATPLAAAISFIVPLPFIDRFAGKLSANIKEYNVVSNKLKLNNFLSVETKDFIAKANNGNAYSKKSEHSTLFFSKKVQIDDLVIQAYKDRAIDLTAYRNGYMQNVLEHAKQDKSITYNTLIYDANDTHVTKAIEHTVLRQEAIDLATNSVVQKIKNVLSIGKPNSIEDKIHDFILAEMQAKNLLGIEINKEYVASKIARIEKAKVVKFSHEIKMTGTDGPNTFIIVNKVAEESVTTVTEKNSNTNFDRKKHDFFKTCPEYIANLQAEIVNIIGKNDFNLAIDIDGVHIFQHKINPDITMTVRPDGTWEQTFSAWIVNMRDEVLTNFLGKDIIFMINDKGNPVYMNLEHTLKVRFDFLEPHGTHKPHAHVEWHNGIDWVDYYDDHMIELNRDKVKDPNVDIVRIMKETIETIKKTTKYDKV